MQTETVHVSFCSLEIRDPQGSPLIALPDCSYSEALERTGMPTLADCRDDLGRRFFQAMLSPSNKLNHLLPTRREVCYGLRSLKNYDAMMAKRECFKKFLIPYGLRHWQ